jgi:hypothetical protein
MCGEKYRREWILGERYANLKMINGTAVHRAADVRHKKIMMDDGETSEEDLAEMTCAFHDKEVEKAKDESNLDETKKEIDKHKDIAMDLARAFAREISPVVKRPILVEETIDFELAPGLVARGTLDLVHRDDEDCDSLADLKTSDNRKNQVWIDTNRQLTFYSMLYLNKFGKLPDAVEGQVIVANKNPIVQFLYSNRIKYDIQSLLKAITFAVKNISKGNFGPASDFAWWCSPDECRHWHRCQYTGGKK